MTTRDKIIRLATQCQMPHDYDTGEVRHLDKLEKFYNLAIQAERDTFCKVLRNLHDTYALMSDPSSLKVRRKGETDDRQRDVPKSGQDHNGRRQTVSVASDEGVPGAVQHSGKADGADGEQQGSKPSSARRKPASVKKAKRV